MDSFIQHKTNQWNKRSISFNRVTDTSLDAVIKYHKLNLANVKSVLIVGVGRSGAIKSLVERGITVYATDISTTLVEMSIEAGAAKAVPSMHMKSLPPADLAISHLVLQHNVEPEVERIINDTQLAVNGIASYQYSTLATDSVMTKLMINDFNEGELNVYSIDRMKDLVSRTNKKWISNIESEKIRDKDFSWDWNVVRFSNK